MKKSLSTTVAIATLLVSIIAQAESKSSMDNLACVPVKRTDWSEAVTKLWIDRAVKQKAVEGNIDILFLGDSITALWRKDLKWANGHKIWNKYYKPLKAISFGVSADRTEHLLWRIGEGKMLEGLTPKVSILLIGINNLTGWGGRKGGDSPESLAVAIGLILDNLKKKIPNTKILLLGIFPALAFDNPIRERIRETNELIIAQADFKKVFYLDIGNKFLPPDGKIDKKIIRDSVHLSEKGYEVWAKNMNPYLLDILNNNGNGKMWEAMKKEKLLSGKLLSGKFLFSDDPASQKISYDFTKKIGTKSGFTEKWSGVSEGGWITATAGAIRSSVKLKTTGIEKVLAYKGTNLSSKFTLFAKVKVNTSDGTHFTGVAFNIQDAKNFYVFRVNSSPSRGMYQVLKMVDGTWQGLKSSKFTAVKSNAPFILMVQSRAQGFFTVSIRNGKKVVLAPEDVNDAANAYAGGNAGVYMGTAGCRVINFNLEIFSD